MTRISGPGLVVAYIETDHHHCQTKRGEVKEGKFQMILSDAILGNKIMHSELIPTLHIHTCIKVNL